MDVFFLGGGMYFHLMFEKTNTEFWVDSTHAVILTPCKSYSQEAFVPLFLIKPDLIMNFIKAMVYKDFFKIRTVNFRSK